MTDFGYWTIVTNFGFWTIATDFGFWTIATGYLTLMADFGFWILDFGHYWPIFDATGPFRKLNVGRWWLIWKFCTPVPDFGF